MVAPPAPPYWLSASGKHVDSCRETKSVRGEWGRVEEELGKVSKKWNKRGNERVAEENNLTTTAAAIGNALENGSSPKEMFAMKTTGVLVPRATSKDPGQRRTAARGIHFRAGGRRGDLWTFFPCKMSCL